MAVQHALIARGSQGIRLLASAGDEEARHRGTQKSVLERKGPATFPVVIEMRERAFWVSHWTEESVDLMLLDKDPIVQVRLLALCNSSFCRMKEELPSQRKVTVREEEKVQQKMLGI